MAEIHALAVDAMRTKGAADAAALAAKAVAGEADGTYLTAHAAEVPTWRQRDYTDVPVGTPYKWQGRVYKLWQAHDATQQPDWSPDKAVSLWDLCHTKDPALATEYQPPQGTRGLWQEGECCVQLGHIWRCLTADNAYGPAELPERWEDLGAVNRGEAAE